MKRLCAFCRDKWHLDMEELQEQIDVTRRGILISLIIVGFVAFLMGIGVGLFIPWIVRFGWWG